MSRIDKLRKIISFTERRFVKNIVLCSVCIILFVSFRYWTQIDLDPERDTSFYMFGILKPGYYQYQQETGEEYSYNPIQLNFVYNGNDNISMIIMQNDVFKSCIFMAMNYVKNWKLIS